MVKLKNILKEWTEKSTGPKRWFKPYGDKYTEYEKATNKDLKEDNKKENLEDSCSLWDMCECMTGCSEMAAPLSSGGSFSSFCMIGAAPMT